MMRRKSCFLIQTFLVLAALIHLSACNDDGGFTPTQPNPIPTGSDAVVFALEGQYLNPTGRNASFTISQSDPSVNLSDSEISLRQTGNIVDITLGNLSISDSITYAIDSTVVREDVGGLQRFSEFKVSPPQQLTKISVVLVLDVSESLGGNFDRLKTFAIDFARDIKTNTPEARIGVVAFSTNIQFLGLSSALATIESYINDLEVGQFTALYDAMRRGIDLLADTTEAADARALVTFTDGRDNASNLAVSNPDSLVGALEGTQIKSFTIGLSGRDGLDELILTRLAVGGAFASGADIQTVQQIFSNFSRAVSNIYRITYSRNDQIITSPRRILFEFYTKPNE